MRAHTTRRFISFLPTLLIASIAVFVVMRSLPGDIAYFVLGGSEGARLTEAQRQAVYESLDLDKPLVAQYALWVGRAVQFDFGTSLTTGRAVRDELIARFPVTAEIALVSWLLSLLLGIPVGVVQAVRRGTPLDYALRLASIGGLAMPAFLLASLVLLWLVYQFNWMPPVGIAALGDDPITHFQQIAISVLVLSYLHAGLISRITRSQVLEAQTADYVRTARAKGLRELLVVRRHVLRNALLPVVTISGLQFGQLLSGTVILERLFTLPGIGNALITGIQRHDFPLVQGTVLLLIGCTLLVNALTDATYTVLDPRIE